MFNPYLDAGQSQHYRGLSGIGADVEVIMQWNSDSVTVEIGGSYRAGSVLVNTLDWADQLKGSEEKGTKLRSLSPAFTSVMGHHHFMSRGG
jgi:hypothetical protein